MCDVLSQERCFSNATELSEKASYQMSKNLKKSQETDSGIQGSFDRLNEMPQRISNCSTTSSAFSSLHSRNSPETSAYSSAASSCCDVESVQVRRKSEGLPPKSSFYNNLNNNNCRYNQIPELSSVQPVTSRRIALTAVPIEDIHARRCRLTSSKSEQSVNESRRLYDSVSQITYEKRHLIGKGGFAKVYEVVQKDCGEEKRYAAKVIEKSRIIKPQQRAKVDIEIELLAESSGHPNIVGYQDSFEDSEMICILLELCKKKSLAQYLRKKNYLSEEEVSKIILQIISGLSHLHNKGIIHRDLKLGNILLTEDMTVKIGDFGLATRLEWGKKSTICGTPNFIAPEVLQRQGHGVEADIWALGCLLYTLLVGKPPFETACLRETYRCILKNSYKMPLSVSSEAADLICWMLQPKPKSRPLLSELSKHPFFTKNEANLSKKSAIPLLPSFISRATPEPIKICPVSTTTPKRSSVTVSPDVNSHTLVAVKSSDVCEVSPPRNGSPVTHCDKIKVKSVSSGTRSPIKYIANKLQKKLGKVRSPAGKCARLLGNNSSKACSPASTPVQVDTSCKNNTAAQPKSSATNQTSSTWVSKWVDYSNRYGFGYQLSNGRVCALFNDGKHISMLADGKNMEYSTSDNRSSVIRFTTNSVPKCLEGYANMLKNFIIYMNKNLTVNSSLPKNASQVDDGARVLTWRRTDEYVAMYLSNGTLQINFSGDHVKFNISSLHKRSSMLITVVDAERKCSVYDADDFVNKADEVTLQKLAKVHSEFHHIFDDVNCNTHPFCGIHKQLSENCAI